MPEQLEDAKAQKDDLIPEALRLFIDKTRRENLETRSWIRQPNNLISVVAIVLSLLSVAYQIYRDWSDAINSDLASLSKIVSDVTQLDSQLLAATTITDNLQTAINNRRVVLLAEADRLINKLGDRVPKAQLAVLGPEYADINDFTTAIKYLQVLTSPTSPRTEQLEAWRSIGILKYEEGPAALDGARKAFDQAAKVWPDPRDVGSITLELSVYEQWGNLELGLQSYPEAFQHLLNARLLVNRLPCTSGGGAIATRIDAQGQGALEYLRKNDPEKARSAGSAWSQAISADKCPKAPPAQPAPITGSRNDAKTTTICRFTNGPRIGTTFDFKSYGLPGIPVGSPCTDGQGSTGVAVR